MLKYEFNDGERRQVRKTFKDAMWAHSLTTLEPTEEDKVQVMLRCDSLLMYYARAELHPAVANESLPPDRHARALASTISVTVCRLADKIEEDGVDGPVLVSHMELSLIPGTEELDGKVLIYFVVHLIPSYFRD